MLIEVIASQITFVRISTYKSYSPVLFSFIGSRPTMADKILRRTSYGGEQTENQKGWFLIE